MSETENLQDRALTNVEASQTEAGSTEIDLVELLYRLLENLKYIIATALVCALLAGIYSFVLATPIYESVAKLYVMSNGDSAINLADLQIGSYLTNDYQEVFKTWEVNEMVMENLNLTYSYTELQEMVSITNPSDTRILYITVKSADAQQATDIANEYASVVKRYISQTMATEEPNVLSVALKPSNPVSPQKARNIIFGFLIGMALSIAIVTVRFIMDDRLKTPDDIQKYIGLDTLAVIPVMNASHGSRYGYGYGYGYGEGHEEVKKERKK